MLMENWRRYQLIMERINSLDPDTGRRFVLDTLVEVTEKDNESKIKTNDSKNRDSNYIDSNSNNDALNFGDDLDVPTFLRDNKS